MFNDVEYEVWEAMKNKSVIEIFNEMDYGEEVNKDKTQKFDNSLKSNEKFFNNESESFNDIREILKNKKESTTFDSAVEAAVKAQNKWKNSSALNRANALHKIWEILKELLTKLSKSKNEVSILLDYFDFYSDLTIQTEEYNSCRPQGVILVVLSNYSPPFPLSATVPAVLAAGCSVIVLAPERAKVISLFLKEVIAEAGLPEGLFNVVTDFDEDNIPVSKKISKVFYCGSYLSAQKLYAKNLSNSFSFFCPNNTAALILESSDLNAAVDKIIPATWGNNSLFALSTIIVQESVYDTFLKKLKYRIEQFMIENKSSTIFKDVITSEKINKIILEALGSGASVEKSYSFENIWSPTVIINYQNQNIDDVPILKVLICRTAKEGVALMNNCRYNIGVSVWSEITSQALEISSMLVCPNIWINCHGVFQASEPFQNGDCDLGGGDGILAYMSFTSENPPDASEISEEKDFNIDKFKVLLTAIEAQRAFNCWKNIKYKRKYMKDIAHALVDNKELSKLSEVISTYAHFGNILNFSERYSTQEFLVVKRKLPLGVILLVVNTTHIDITSLVSLITLPIVLGNAVIIVMRDENSFVNLLIEYYNKFLPKNLLNIFTGIRAGIYLASDPNIQAIWLFDETAISTEFLQNLRTYSSRDIKHIWVVPKNISVSQYFFQKECLRNKVVWLTTVDQFS